MLVDLVEEWDGRNALKSPMNGQKVQDVQSYIIKG